MPKFQRNILPSSSRSPGDGSMFLRNVDILPPSSGVPEDGGSMFLRNVCDTMQQPRRPVDLQIMSVVMIWVVTLHDV
jgi:hypothetical protein